MCPRNWIRFFLILSISFLLVSIFFEIFRLSHILFIVFSVSFCRSTTLLTQISSSSVRNLHRIHCHGCLIIYRNSALSFDSNEDFLFLQTLFSFWQVFSASDFGVTFRIKTLSQIFTFLYLLVFDITHSYLASRVVPLAGNYTFSVFLELIILANEVLKNSFSDSNQPSVIYIF